MLLFLTILIAVIVLVNNVRERQSNERANAQIKEIVDTITPFMDGVHDLERKENTDKGVFDFSIDQYIQSLNVHMYLFGDSGIMADDGNSIDETGHTVGLLSMDDDIAGTYSTIDGKVDYINIIGTVPNLADDRFIHVLTVFMSSMLAVEGQDAEPDGLGEILYDAIKSGVEKGSGVVELRRKGYKVAITYSVLIGEMITITPD